MRFSRVLIALLLGLLTGSMAVAADQRPGIVIGRVQGIDQQRRELLVLPVGRAIEGSGTRSQKKLLRVKLSWDLSEAEPFLSLLPACVMQGNRIKIVGTRGADSLFVARKLRGCGAQKSFRDKTGVRFRLNRVRGDCAPE